MIYLASPYSHVRSRVRRERFLAAEAYLASCTALGEILYSPIVHFHTLARRHKLPHDATYWRAHNEGMLSMAEELRVLVLPGWEHSIGIAREVAFAKENSIPVTHVLSDVGGAFNYRSHLETP